LVKIENYGRGMYFSGFTLVSVVYKLKLGYTLLSPKSILVIFDVHV